MAENGCNLSKLLPLLHNLNPKDDTLIALNFMIKLLWTSQPPLSNHVLLSQTSTIFIPQNHFFTFWPLLWENYSMAKTVTPTNINQEGFPIFSYPLYIIILLDLNKDILMHSNHVYNLILIKWNKPKITQNKRIVLNMHTLFLSYKKEQFSR